jgi:hypothetical protein
MAFQHQKTGTPATIVAIDTAATTGRSMTTAIVTIAVPSRNIPGTIG